MVVGTYIIKDTKLRNHQKARTHMKNEMESYVTHVGFRSRLAQPSLVSLVLKFKTTRCLRGLVCVRGTLQSDCLSGSRLYNISPSAMGNLRSEVYNYKNKGLQAIAAAPPTIAHARVAAAWAIARANHSGLKQIDLEHWIKLEEMKQRRNCTVWLRDCSRTVLSKSYQLLLKNENSNTPVDQGKGIGILARRCGRSFSIVSADMIMVERCRKVITINTRWHEKQSLANLHRIW
jgi:hypothetical protein